MVRVSHGKRNRPPNHRATSRIGRILYQLQNLVKIMRGSPSTFAIVIAQRLGEFVTRQEVWYLLNVHNLTRKKQSPVPGIVLVTI